MWILYIKKAFSFVYEHIYDIISIELNFIV